jgi:hypothetical protein
MMEAARTSETSVDNYFTRQYIPENKSEINYSWLSISKLQPKYFTPHVISSSFQTGKIKVFAGEFM